MIDHNLWSLRGRLRQLSRLLREEAAHPRPDLQLIDDLTRRREALKEEIYLAEAGLSRSR